MREDMRKNVIRMLKTALLGVALSHAGLYGYAQSQTQAPTPGVAQNPYIQSGPTVSGPMMQQQGVQRPQQEVNNPEAISSVYYPDIKTYVLAPGDLINVRLYGVPDYAMTLRIGKDGTAVLPLIGNVALAGLTIFKAQTLIEDRLRSDGMYRAPHITITLGEFDESQTLVQFAGEVHGVLPLRKTHTVAEAISAVGGLPPGASPVVSIIRSGVDHPIIVDLGTTADQLVSANIPLQPKDTIFVQKAGAVYVVGAFKTTGLFQMQPGRTTLLQIAALSGGPLYSARAADMRVIRTVGTERTEVKVDIEKVLYGKAPDPILQSGDIVFLPTSAVKNAISSGGLSVLLQILNIAIIAALR